MSSILNVGRSILAILQPLFGERATGTCMFTPVNGVADQIPAHTYMSPLVNGALRTDLLFKIPINPATYNTTTGRGGEWPIASGGSALPVISNLGGSRYNLQAGTVFRIEPDVGGNITGTTIATVDFTGGTDNFSSPDQDVADIALRHGVLYETFAAADDSFDMFRSNLGTQFPAVVLHWAGDEPADGMVISDLQRPGKRGSTAMQYSVEFELWLICARSDNEAARRGQAMRLLDEISDYLYDRMAVDGLVFSSPGGINIRGRSRENGNGEQFYKAYRVYSVRLTATITQEKRVLRTPAQLVQFSANYLAQSPPTEAPQNPVGNLPMLHDDKIPNPTS